jgi:ATP-dependent Zn protease
MSQRILNYISKQGLGLCRNSIVRNTSYFNTNLCKIQQINFKQRFEYRNSYKYYSTDSKQESNAESNSSKKKMSFKELMKKYGWAAFIMYNIVTILDTSIIFVFLYFSGGEQVKYIENKVKEWSSYLSFSKPKEVSVIEETDNKPQGDEKPSLMSTFLVAYSLHQLLEPIRLPLVVFLTPSFALKLHRLNILKMKNI